jgi:hypothetical protein
MLGDGSVRGATLESCLAKLLYCSSEYSEKDIYGIHVSVDKLGLHISTINFWFPSKNPSKHSSEIASSWRKRSHNFLDCYQDFICGCSGGEVKQIPIPSPNFQQFITELHALVILCYVAPIPETFLIKPQSVFH